MKKFLLLGITALMSAGAGLALSKTANVEKEELNANIIVQLKSPLANKSTKKLLAEQSALISDIHNEVTTSYEIGSRYTNVLNAFSMRVNAAHVSQIRNLPGVKRVEYNREHVFTSNESDLITRDSTKITEETENISKKTMGIPDDTNEGEGTLIAILDTGFMVHATTDPNDQAPIYKDFNDETHAAFTALGNDVTVKYSEAGIKTVIDGAEHFNGKATGDETTYLNSKVPFYYDYGGDVALKGASSKRDAPGTPDTDVYTEASDHGNHVATIAAGNDPFYKGIAPKAQLALMKVFTSWHYYDKETGDDGTEKITKVTITSAFDSCILSAFEDCMVLGVDVINMSLGSALFEITDNKTSGEAMQALKNRGTEFAISAGNEGKELFYSSAYENWTTGTTETGILGSYAVMDQGTIIASGQPDKQYYDQAFVVGKNVVAFKDQVVNREGADPDYDVERKFIELLDLEGHEDGVFDWVKIPGLGADSDFEQIKKDSSDKKPCANKIAVIDRGELTFGQKIQNAITYGAIACAIINNDPTATDFNFRMSIGYTPKIPVVALLYADKNIFGVGGTTGTAKIIKDQILSNPKARQVSNFSSDGATADLRIKPEITTPGSNILGGVFEGGRNAYDYYSGTSMAAPNYAGAYAVALSEHLDDATWRRTLTDRLMSGAEPMYDKYGYDETKGGNFESIRKQGAGLLNLSNSLNTEVILDGSADPTNLLGRAKIELKNNNDIKNGIVNLNFTTISSAQSDIVYNTELQVYKPATATLDEEHFGEKLAGETYMALYDDLITTVKGTLTVQPGAHAANVSYTLTDAQKQAINATFENGCYIEGMLVLSAENKPSISIPYLGFFGDYDSISPVEPFKFERDNSKVYNSDLVNYIGEKWVGVNGCDFASDWVMGNWTDLKNLSMESMMYNEKFLRDTVDDNSKKVVPVGTNPYTGKTETTDIYMGNNGATNTMIIAQFVNRSVFDNVITITNKATGKLVLTDHMFDSLFGAMEDDNEEDYQWPLCKSWINPDYYSSGILAHRAYTIIPLYKYEWDKVKEEYHYGDLWEDGEYEIKFHYDLQSGGTYEKKYTLHIDSQAPKVETIEKRTDNNNDYLRIRFDEEKLSYLAVNGYKKEVQKDENGYYFDAKISDYAEKDKIYVQAYDFSYGISNHITHVSDTNNVVISAKSFTNAFDFTQDLKEVDGQSFSLSFSYTKSKKSVELNETIDVLMNVSKYMVENGDVKVYTVDAAGAKTEIQFVLAGSMLSFSGNANATFFIDCDINNVAPTPVDPEPVDPDEPVNPDQPDDGGKKKSGGCGGSIIAGSAILSITAALGFALMMFKKKHD